MRLEPLEGSYTERMGRHFAPTALDLPPPPPPYREQPRRWGVYVPPRRGLHPAYVRILSIGIFCAVVCWWMRMVWASVFYFGARYYY